MISSENEIEEFIKIFPIIKNDILESLKEKNFNNEYIEWVDQLLEVNSLGGKYFRGLTVLDTVKDIHGGNIDDETIFLSKICGWCIELLQASLLIADDIMDGGTMRRNHLCWYRFPNPITQNIPIDKIAINDAFLLESFIYLILKKYFKTKEYYIDIIELFHEVSLNTFMGQLLDTSPRVLKKGDFLNFNFERYSQIMKFKKSFYTLYIPVIIGMLMCGIKEVSNSTKNILMDIGELMSVQDDFFDVFGSFEMQGKIGTDIQENKITWLICQALSKSNNDQLQLLSDHYGRENQDDVKIVKELYYELDLPKVYQEYEDTQYLNIMNKIKFESNIPQSIFIRLLQRYYKRTK